MDVNGYILTFMNLKMIFINKNSIYKECYLCNRIIIQLMTMNGFIHLKSAGGSIVGHRPPINSW